MNNSHYHQLIILISFFMFVSAERSHATCEYNFDCESCVHATGCMWTAQTAASEAADGTNTVGFVGHVLHNHVFFECASESGPFNINGTAHSANTPLIIKTTSLGYCDKVNTDYQNKCTRLDRSTFETCVAANNYAYRDLIGCAWDMQFKLCANKGRLQFHPNEISRYRYVFQAGTYDSNLINLLAAMVILFIVSICAYACVFYRCKKQAREVRNSVVDYEIHLHPAKNLPQNTDSNIL